MSVNCGRGEFVDAVGAVDDVDVGSGRFPGWVLFSGGQGRLFEA